MKKYMCWYGHEEPYVSSRYYGRRMVGSTSSSSNVFGVVDYNSIPYRNMVIDAMKIN
jgi:hypothetical protein